MKANVGMRYAVAAVVASYTPYSSITYDTGFVVAEARGANLTWETADGEFRGDDVVLDSSNEVLGYTLEMETAGMKDGARSKLMGETADTNSVYHITGTPSPDVGMGYIKQMREDATTTGIVETTWEAFWYHKLKFAQPNDEVRTQERSREWRPQTITGKGAGVFLSSGQEQPDWAEHKTFSTLSAAKSYLNGKAGIT